mmetsp:Transcript_54312/g.129071  ORF Transcript_54312/g.129071 Transcript_54312/m.129071 type:complete len:209 (+) Transcript_54312:1082-1708(+)
MSAPAPVCCGCNFPSRNPSTAWSMKETVSIRNRSGAAINIDIALPSGRLSASCIFEAPFRMDVITDTNSSSATVASPSESANASIARTCRASASTPSPPSAPRSSSAERHPLLSMSIDLKRSRSMTSSSWSETSPNFCLSTSALRVQTSAPDRASTICRSSPNRKARRRPSYSRPSCQNAICIALPGTAASRGPKSPLLPHRKLDGNP